MSDLPSIPQPGEDPELDAFADELAARLVAPSTMEDEAALLFQDAGEND